MKTLRKISDFNKFEKKKTSNPKQSNLNLFSQMHIISSIQRKMKLGIFGVLFISLLRTASHAQEFGLYSNDSLLIESRFLQSSISINLHLPETFHYSSPTTQYPVTIIFDSQHERTYPQLIRSFDLLTSETQIPESIIIGIPFNIENRYYLTSNQKKDNDTLMGIERMELFIFNELLPKLRNKYKANDFLTMMGHSRTAFLVNYLCMKRTKQINVALSFSGFFSEPPISIESFSAFLRDQNNFTHKFSYYATSGSTLEESTYLNQYKKVFNTKNHEIITEKTKIQFKENQHTNHMTNYWISVPEILIDAFSDYNFVLDNWFHQKLKVLEINNPVEEFQNDLKHASQKIGYSVLPSLTHLFSLSSHFGYQQKEYEKAIAFLEYGLNYYPDFLELFSEIIEMNKLLDNQKKVDFYKAILKEKAVKSTFITEKERIEIFNYLQLE